MVILLDYKFLIFFVQGGASALSCPSQWAPMAVVYVYLSHRLVIKLCYMPMVCSVCAKPPKDNNINSIRMVVFPAYPQNRIITSE